MLYLQERIKNFQKDENFKKSFKNLTNISGELDDFGNIKGIIRMRCEKEED